MRPCKINLKYGRWGPYNNPEVNERKAELPLGFWFASCFSKDLIEVGEVTPFYREPQHVVCDMVPEKPTTLKTDALAMDFSKKNVLSISTVEHVGTSDYGLAPEPGKAFRLLEKISAEARNWLVTFAVGSNRALEGELLQSELDFFLLERTPDNFWRQPSTKMSFSSYQYNAPLPHGNAVIVVTNLNLDVSFDGYAEED